MLEADKITKQYLYETYGYYINLVKYIDIDIEKIKYAHNDNDITFKIDDISMVYKFLELLNKEIIEGCLFRPIDISSIFPGINIILGDIETFEK